ncbi:hypothetical protein HYH02_002267 [Chlamydomonas schloesseri]|uniref:EGF-like domain-containing protein n=1 Tax=Chlamydomonas schloesseri TaxID=2026947 RepID=A0A835WTD6_9CHLO|nr:hypothetical protein HYH02_002267 [Chlamydomonas schloesseri]|eukprot:KAG2452928.1 hypothetical protein HYH02_002267 [Chlamydomonas schloesseri]
MRGNRKVATAAALLLLGIALLPLLQPAIGQKTCPEGCSKFGTCNLELGRCDCPWNYTGDACQTHNPAGFCVKRLGVDNPINTCKDGHPTLCVNACNGRGDCKGGFCHCKEGYFGTDCALSYNDQGKIEVLAGLNYRLNKRGPKIYIYEVPPEYHVKRDIHKVDRPPLQLAFMERILSGGHRTHDPEEADFFYVPGSARDLKKAFLLQPLLAYISTTWPYWNATGGARHVMPAEGDVGTCELPLKVRLFTANVTWLQFWGMYDFHPHWTQIFHNRIPCMVPGRDIVVPFMAMSSHDRFVIETPLHPRNQKRNRTNVFFFAGGVCGSGNKRALPPHCTYYKQVRYSGGVRQAVYLHFHNRTGWRVVPGTDDYARDYASSRFCLAAAGGGWGKRGIVAAMYGCIPVAATDMLYEAFEPEMDWGRFGVRISQAEIPQLADKLEAFSEAQVARMQERTACAAQHLHWSTNLGGIMGETGEFDAFNTIMAILRMRRKRPDLKPEQYYDTDEDFRNFIDCKPYRPSARHTPLCTMYVGPGMEPRGFEDACPAARYYFRRKMGPPGGAICALANSTAACPVRTGGRADGAWRSASQQLVQLERGAETKGGAVVPRVAAVAADDPKAAAPPLCTMFISPLYTKFDDTCPAKHFRYYMRRKMGPPGGAICVDATDLASCRRFD